MKIRRPGAADALALGQSTPKQFRLHFIGMGLLCGLFSLVLFINHEEVSTWYVIIQFLSVAAGVFHVFYVNQKLVWGGRYIFLKKIAYTFGVLLWSVIVFFLLTYFLVLKGLRAYTFIYITSTIPFLIPFFLTHTFDKAIQILPKRYKLWFYNEKTNMPDLDLIDFSNSFILSFEFPKIFNDTSISNFKFKAPLDMQFGELYFMYLFEYNDKNRTSPIEYQDTLSNAYGWIFYVKPQSWWQRKRILDPHLTIRQNKLRENEVIAPQRFIVE